MQESAQSAKISGTPPERGHSCPQQLPNTQQDRNVRELYFRSTLLRTRMSALRFGSGSAGLGTDAPYHPAVTEALLFVQANDEMYPRAMKSLPFSLLGLFGAVLAQPLRATDVWTVRVEEPTGLYPRTNEVVAVPYAKFGGR